MATNWVKYVIVTPTVHTNLNGDVKMDFQEKAKYNFDDLVQIVKILRAPGGCPWDMEQTHKSIRMNFIEETYEAVEAIDTDDTELLREELGDVLLQVALHSEMESEINSFDINDVIDGVCKKLVVRHPHVFGEKTAENTEQALSNWDAVKMQMKSQRTQAQAMDSVSKALPSLMRAQKILQKSAKSGFEFPVVEGAIHKLDEEVDELKAAVLSGDIDGQHEELGDVLFSAVNIARMMGVDSEKALYDACNKFIIRYTLLESLAHERELDMKTASIQQLNSLWEEVKIKLK